VTTNTAGVAITAATATMAQITDGAVKKEVSARNLVAVTGLKTATGVPATVVDRGNKASATSATRVTVTADHATRSLLETAAAMAVVPVEVPAGTAAMAVTMEASEAGGTEMPTLVGTGMTTGAVGRIATTAAVIAGKSAASGIVPQTRSRPGSVMKKRRGGGRRISVAAVPAIIFGREIASARM
jgi:hypothetical protein